MKRNAIFTAVVAVAALASAANANVYVFGTTGNSAGTPVSATASFTTSAGLVSLDLTNTTPHTADAGQLLTGIRFTLSNGITFVTNGTSFTATGIPRTTEGDGSFADGASGAISWSTQAFGNGYQFDFNPDAKHAILGPADVATPLNYSGNGSINGNPGHNPFTALTGHFTLASGLITSETVVGDIAFLWNTNKDYITPPGGGGGETPEPASLGVLSLGAVALLARRRRKA